jgi:hypothetical protein
VLDHQIILIGSADVITAWPALPWHAAIAQWICSVLNSDNPIMSSLRNFCDRLNISSKAK